MSDTSINSLDDRAKVGTFCWVITQADDSGITDDVQVIPALAINPVGYTLVSRDGAGHFRWEHPTSGRSIEADLVQVKEDVVIL